MSFVSFQYAVFLATVFGIYWLTPKKVRWIVLLALSYVFYAFAGIWYVGLLLYVTVCAYFWSVKAKGKKWLDFLAVFFTVLPLIYFKYYNFILENIRGAIAAFHKVEGYDLMDIVVPLGISFYTFSALAYVADCRSGKIKPFENIFHLAAGLSFFPCLISGPIERQQKLVPKIIAGPDFTYDKGTWGLKTIAWGLFKKLVVADLFGLTVDSVYSRLDMFKGWPLLLAVFMYSIQIYCDFSGYSDIAIGSAALFGIDLEKNFDAPYLSLSIKEFWSRWHISLSSWLRDYVYIPLGGNRKGWFRRDINLLITFLVSGLWHGADWTFVIWGLLHGAFLVTENHSELASWKNMSKTRVVRWIRIIFDFILITAAWVFFRASTFQDAAYIFKNIFSKGPVIPPEVGYKTSDVFVLLGIDSLWDGAKPIIAFVVLFIYDVVGQKRDLWKIVSRRPAVVRWIFYIFIAIVIVFMKPEFQDAQFIYFKF